MKQNSTERLCFNVEYRKNGSVIVTPFDQDGNPEIATGVSYHYSAEELAALGAESPQENALLLIESLAALDSRGQIPRKPSLEQLKDAMGPTVKAKNRDKDNMIFAHSSRYGNIVSYQKIEEITGMSLPEGVALMERYFSDLIAEKGEGALAELLTKENFLAWLNRKA